MRRKSFRELIHVELDTASITSAFIGAIIVLAIVMAVGLIAGTVQPMFT
jgi:uncharacterized membrane protein YeaQ/YmgE (transglycosylase-associated protein family)